MKSPTDDGLVSEYCRFDEAAAAIAGSSLPAASSMLCDRLEMLIALRGAHSLSWNHNQAQGDNDVVCGVADCHGIVNKLSVISAIGDYGGNWSIDPVEQVRQRGDIAEIILGQFAGTDFLGIGVNRDVKFPPASAQPGPVLLIQPFAFAVDSEAGAVDQ